jgi:hypothetical protein
VDDDTYINLDWFTHHYDGFDSSIPRADAGCLVIHPAHMTNFSFPFGGFGLFLTQGTVANLIRLIHCQVEAMPTVVMLLNPTPANRCNKYCLGNENSIKMP